MSKSSESSGPQTFKLEAALDWLVAPLRKCQLLIFNFYFFFDYRKKNKQGSFVCCKELKYHNFGFLQLVRIPFRETHENAAKSSHILPLSMGL